MQLLAIECALGSLEDSPEAELDRPVRADSDHNEGWDWNYRT